MPGQQSIGGDQVGEVVEGATPDPFAFGRQPAALIIMDSRYFTQLFFEDANLLLQIREDLLLVAVPPTGDRNEEQGERIHCQMIPGLKPTRQHNC